MPKCYRTGGLACQHRFGARHGTSVVIFGLFKMGLAVIFGSSVLTLLGALPVAVSGVMVAIVGLERVGTVCWSSRWRRKKTGGGTRSGIFDQNSTAGEDFECNVTGNRSRRRNAEGGHPYAMMFNGKCQCQLMYKEVHSQTLEDCSQNKSTPSKFASCKIRCYNVYSTSSSISSTSAC
ncbi:hypothetical protein HJC23_012557 [Cyclotella cryptica]|uniref:Uncharacterized protein n=1 Tax=Cyclotella cryptica TaxID=29204 RepID=A0ABD3QQD9_9STRA